jgi:hypothetical protein
VTIAAAGDAVYQIGTPFECGFGGYGKRQKYRNSQSEKKTHQRDPQQLIWSVRANAQCSQNTLHAAIPATGAIFGILSG